MFKSILVAVDGSVTSDRALDAAIRLAKETGARLRIVNVIDEVSFNWGTEFPDLPEIWDALAANGRALLAKAAATASKGGITAETRLIEIDRLGIRIPEAIAQEAEAWQADLVVVGSHGRRGISHALLGSVAEGVMRVSTKPVLLIRGQQE